MPGRDRQEVASWSRQQPPQTAPSRSRLGIDVSMLRHSYVARKLPFQSRDGHGAVCVESARHHFADEGGDGGPIGIFPMDYGEITIVMYGDGVGGGPPGLLRLQRGGGRRQLIHFHLERAGAFVPGAPGAADSQALDLFGSLIRGQIARLFQFPGAHCRGEQRRGLRGSAARKQQQGRQSEGEPAPGNQAPSAPLFSFSGPFTGRSLARPL